MKVQVNLTPYNSLTILSFLREFIHAGMTDDYKLQAIKEAVEEYEEEVYKNMTNEQLSDAVSENSVNQLIGKSPKRK